MGNGAPSSRPLSPHLQIWRFTATMAASITHRGTGTVLYGGTLLIGIWLIALGFNEALFNGISAFINTSFGWIIIAGYVWSLSFHLLNGLRHLYWDSGRGLAPKTATMTAWAVYIAATLITAFILFAAGGVS